MIVRLLARLRLVPALAALFSSDVAGELAWESSNCTVENKRARGQDLETVSPFSVIAAALILVMAVSGNKDIPH